MPRRLQKTPRAARPIDRPVFTPSPVADSPFLGMSLRRRSMLGQRASPSPGILRPVRQDTMDVYIHQLQRNRRVAQLGTGKASATAAARVALPKKPQLALQQNATKLLRDAQERSERLREKESLREEVEAEGGYYFSDEDE